MTDGKAADIPELNPLQMGPQALAGVQFWGIGRQTLDVEPWRRAVTQERFDDLTAVNRRPIPDNDHTAWHLSQQMFQKGHHIHRIEGAVLAMEIQLPLWGDRADGREMLAGPPLLQDRGLSNRCIGADDAGQRIEPGFIDEKDALPLGLRPLLIAGHVSWRQRAMATSSRWRARRAGFCGLQRIALSKRPTWTG
jgi:hypothetical protein